MLKIGIVGGTGITHARLFSEMLNGYDKNLVAENDWPQFRVRVKNARVTHIWDEKKKDACLLAKICGVKNIVNRMEDMIGKVDGIIIPDDCTMKHQKRAFPFLKAGIPTFIDKPLSTSIKEAQKIIEIAQKYNAPMMSCSALRYAKEVEEFKTQTKKIGDVLTGSTICGGDLIFYGIHAFEQLYSTIGPGIKSVRNVGKKGDDIVIVRYKDGRKFVLFVYENIKPLFQMSLYGTKGCAQVVVTDGEYFCSNMLKAFIKMVDTKKMPFSPEETIEILKVLILGKKSRKNRAELEL